MRAAATPTEAAFEGFDAYVSARGHGWERYAHALTGDGPQAQDLVQSVLLRLLRHWDRLTALDHPDAYVRRMITTTFLDQRRRRSSTELTMPTLPDRRLSPDPAAAVVARDDLRRGLAVLTPQQRAVLVLRHVQGLSDEQIAGVVGASVSTVRSHASRGRDRFRAALTQEDAL